MRLESFLLTYVSVLPAIWGRTQIIGLLCIQDWAKLQVLPANETPIYDFRERKRSLLRSYGFTETIRHTFISN